MLLSLVSGLLYGTKLKSKDNKKLFGDNNVEAVLLAALVTFRVFLYIQKRVHKEIFFEMKQRSAEQGEFKTIFNELDEGIVITQQNRITKFNNVF